MKQVAENVKISRWKNVPMSYTVDYHIQYKYNATLLNLDTQKSVKTFRQKWKESLEARARGLSRNAARMREKRANETYEDYKLRLTKNAETNRTRRQNESEVQRALRLLKNAARQRLRRANETHEERAIRLLKAAERMRLIRAHTPKIVKPPLEDRLIGY